MNTPLLPAEEGGGWVAADLKIHPNPDVGQLPWKSRAPTLGEHLVVQTMVVFKVNIDVLVYQFAFHSPVDGSLIETRRLGFAYMMCHVMVA
jgi:hypothetical protein